jgi:hypothetical protein
MPELGEWLPDLPAKDNPGVIVAENLLPFANSYLPVNSPVADTNALKARCRGGAAIKAIDGVEYNYAGDETDLYYRSDNDYLSVNTGYTLAETNNWEFIRFNDKVIAANGVDPLQVSDITDPPLFADIAGSPQARHIATVGNFVVTGNLPTNPRLLKWSGIGDETIWTPGDQQSDEQVLQRGGEITRILGGEYGVVFCEHSIYRLQYASYPIIFEIDEVIPGSGTRAPGSVSQYGNIIYYLDTDGFYVFNGSTINPIGANKINRTFFADYDDAYPHRVTSAIDLANTMYWCAYPGTGHVDGLPNRVVVFNWSTNRWSGPIKIEVEQLLYSSLQEVVTDSLLGLTDDYNQMTDSIGFAGTPASLSLFNSAHEHAIFTGPRLEGWIESGEFTLDDWSYVLGLEPRADGDDVRLAVSLGTRNPPYGIVEWTPLQSPHPRTGIARFHKRAKYIRFRIRVQRDFTHLYGAVPHIVPAGKQ